MKRFNKVLSLLIAAIMISSLFAFGAMASTTTGVTEIFRDDFNDDDFSNWVADAANQWTLSDNQDGSAKFTNNTAWKIIRSGDKSKENKYIVKFELKNTISTKEFDLGAAVVCQDVVRKNGNGNYFVVCEKTTSDTKINVSTKYYKNDGTYLNVASGSFDSADYPNGMPIVAMNGASGAYADIESIVAYTLNGGVTITVDKINAQSLEITTDAPLDSSTAVFTAQKAGGNTITSSSVQTVSLSDNKYIVNFAESFDYGTTYNLTATTLNGLEGTALTANAPSFTTSAYAMPEYVAPTPFFVEDGNTENTYDTAYKSGSATLTVTREGGSTTFNNSGTGEFILSTPSVTSSNKYYIEYEVSGLTASKYFQVFPGGYYGTAVKQTGKFYGVYDGSSYKVYKDDAVLYEVTSTNATPPKTSDMIGINFNVGVKFNYIVAYPMAEDMSVKIVESNNSGVIFKTTMPINTRSSVAKVGNTALTISTVSGEWCTYKAEFADTIAENEIALTLKKLDGTLAMPETTFEFTLPVDDSSEPFFIENAAAENAYETVYNTAGRATLKISREDGYTKFIREGSGELILSTSSFNASNKYYIEYELNELEMHSYFQAFPGGYYYSGNTGPIKNNKGTFYGVYDGTAQTYTVYLNQGGVLTEKYTVNAPNTQAPTTSDKIGINFNGNEVHLKYIVAYPEAKAMTAEITGSDASGVTFKTTIPINTSTSIATVGGKALVLKPVSGQWCTYKAYFDEITDVAAGENTLKLTLTKLDGTAAMAETEFAFTLNSEATITNATISEANGKIYGAVRVLNTTNNDYKFTCIVASYTNEEKKLDDVKVEEITVPAGEAGVFTTSKALAIDGTNTYSVFLLESLSNLIPIVY